VWADDGEQFIETVAAGWSGQNVYVRLPDRRYRLTSVWLDAADVTRTLGKPPTGSGLRVIDRREVSSRRPCAAFSRCRDRWWDGTGEPTPPAAPADSWW
jgi:hypothetical protein